METWLVGSILGVSVVDDLKSRKFHNFLWLSFLLLSLGYFFAFAEFGFEQLKAIALVSVICLPLVYHYILGAGDYKLLLLLALFLSVTEMAHLLALSFVWNALAGSCKFSVNLLTKTQTRRESLRFPFTFGIFLAWLSLAYLPTGGLL